MTLRVNRIFLFENQTTVASAVSDPFFLNEKPSNFAKPQLRTYGDLDGGTAKLQTLNADVTIDTADNSVSSTDWQDSDDAILEQGVDQLNITSLPCRLKVTNLGASADWNAELIKD